jgi:hypothetical protein
VRPRPSRPPALTQRKAVLCLSKSCVGLADRVLVLTHCLYRVVVKRTVAVLQQAQSAIGFVQAVGNLRWSLSLQGPQATATPSPSTLTTRWMPRASWEPTYAQQYPENLSGSRVLSCR